ncbi:nuclear-interacting partner of ALK isoform X1 [Scyliorhinus canicula]|uniref:nuclear-interacting partner of ALK isoform X1 n=1 Tax=Scyliorhinus canicula TaxID=7830 RepID=UPI0018F585BA|nr:nuclear-interacting partner of ALK isoform X1 [Scyliorhinus canicula]XP_038667705.1 nuclear-interacting partner of ALK isoform X1 [Scyliorhinus canicula]
MAAAVSDGDFPSPNSKNVAETPQKVRQLLSDSIAEIDQIPCSISESPDGSDLPRSPVPCDSANKEAFFSRVETFTSFKWAAVSFELSPLQCAKYGWTSVECDMLKCYSCQAYLCTTLHPTLDANKYKERVAGLQEALKTAHEKFCFWPDSPCPDRFWALPLNEPAALLCGVTERFRNLCLLEFQLPAIKLDDLKDMIITEETISSLLQLVEDEMKCSTVSDSLELKSSADILSVHLSACIIALCGWTAGSSSDFLHLPVITCSYCVRKVGLWSFQQIDVVCPASEPDVPVCSISPQENKPEMSTPTPPAMSPHRMVTRSQDAAQSQSGEQHETSPSPIGSRTRSRDVHSPTLVDRGESDSFSSHLRNKRPVTRSMGQGDVPSSPQRKSKRMRLPSSTSSDSVRGYFDPVSQHRDWCPWVRRKPKLEDEPLNPEPGEQSSAPGTPEMTERGWKEALGILLSLNSSRPQNEGSDSVSLSEKSSKMFRIFRQWQVPCSS